MEQFISLKNQQLTEQALAAVRTMTVLVREYNKGLINEGFPPDQAWALTIAFQNELVRNSKGQQEGA